jgi:hypothetical protein
MRDMLQFGIFVAVLIAFVSRAIILACSRASLSPASSSPSGSGIAFRSCTMTLKKYRGIHREYMNNQKVVVRKRTDL